MMPTSDAVEIWKRTVETQMHFNEMATKSRQLGLTLVVAALGLCAVLMGRGDDFTWVIQVCSFTIRLNVAVLILAAAAFGMHGVSTLDIGVYHKMLRGAVEFGEEFERTNLDAAMGTPMGMTQFISLYSRSSSVKRENNKYVGVPGKTAGEKLRWFYRTTIIVICAIAAAIFLVTQHPMHIERPSTETTQPSTK